MSEVPASWTGEFDDITDLAEQTAQKTKEVIETDDWCERITWAEAQEYTEDSNEAFVRSMARAQMYKLYEIAIEKQYPLLAKRYAVSDIIDALRRTDKLPAVEGYASRIDFPTDDGDNTFLHVAIDIDTIGKSSASHVVMRSGSEVKAYMVTICTDNEVSTHVNTEMIDPRAESDLLRVVNPNQSGNMSLLVAGAVPVYKLEAILSQIREASVDAEPEELDAAIALLTDVYHRKRSAKKFERELGMGDMTMQDFFDMQAELDKRVQQRG